MGLPVLCLPSLVFDNIYQFLDVSDIIFLSQCSRQVRDLVSSQEGPRKGRQVSICFDSGYTTVEVSPKIKIGSPRLPFTLKIYPVGDRESTDEKSFFTLNIDGTTWDVRKCQQSLIEDWYCVPEEGFYENDVLIIVNMLRNLFNCSISHILVFSTSINFNTLFVETDALRRANNIYVNEDEYDPKDMDIMFDHFVTNNLEFWGYSDPEYSYQKPLKFPKVCLERATWVNLENVLEITKTSKHVELYEAKLIADKDINQLIKWWLTSDSKTLEYLTIARGHQSSLPQPSDVELRMNRSVIMEGIQTTPGKKKREEATKNILCDIEWENGVDIVRKDGVQATILVNHQYSYDELLFAVWHHPSPNVDN